MVLSSILLVLLVVRNTSAPDINTSTKSKDSSVYTTLEYKISKIKGNQYYGKGEDGKEILFSGKDIQSGEKIQVGDKVICYFEKNNLGKGLVKVEKK